MSMMEAIYLKLGDEPHLIIEQNRIVLDSKHERSLFLNITLPFHKLVSTQHFEFNSKYYVHISMTSDFAI